jgi:hypothetical protein
MNIDLRTLIWLFPLVFMAHDFEELILGEPWLKKNGARLRALAERRLPRWLAHAIGAALAKPASELACSVGLIFGLCSLAAYLAAERGQYGYFLLASGAFFLHGFMHLGQAVALRGYVPAVISSAVVIIPYGLLLYGRLLAADVVRPAELAFYWAPGVLLTIPFILLMHSVGSAIYKTAVKLLVR